MTSRFVVVEMVIRRGEEYRKVLVGAYITSGPIEAKGVELTASEKRQAAHLLGQKWAREST